MRLRSDGKKHTAPPIPAIRSLYHCSEGHDHWMTTWNLTEGRIEDRAEEELVAFVEGKPCPRGPHPQSAREKP